MKSKKFKSFFIGASFLLISVYIFLPRMTNALTPLDEDEMIQLSPARIAEIIEKEKTLPPLSLNVFEDSICFQKCHTENDFSPSHKTQKQWLILIEKDGHAIFQEIPWQSADEKDRVLIFLLKHARDANTIKEGIGVWD